MIKKIVLIVLSVLFGYLTYVAFMFGIDINLNLPFSTKVLPYKQIMTNGTTLNAKITRINTLNTTEVALKNNELDTQRANFEEKREAYAKLEAEASEEEIAEANKKQEYLLDYLWIVIGNYANDNNVRFKMTTDEVNLRINFDITGSYISIINFIYDIENDKNLKFNLNGIELASSSSADTTKASFSVDGITVKTTNVPTT